MRSGPDYAYRATVEYVVDGDTIDVALDLGMRITIRTRLRIAHVDAPEVSTQAGRDARDFVRELLPPGTEVLVRTQKPDKYGRALADVELPNGRDLGDHLQANGHARPYEGGHRG